MLNFWNKNRKILGTFGRSPIVWRKKGRFNASDWRQFIGAILLREWNLPNAEGRGTNEQVFSSSQFCQRVSDLKRIPCFSFRRYCVTAECFEHLLFFFSCMGGFQIAFINNIIWSISQFSIGLLKSLHLFSFMVFRNMTLLKKWQHIYVNRCARIARKDGADVQCICCPYSPK